MGKLLIAIMISVAALLLIIAADAYAVEYNLIEGTACNDWTAGAHSRLGDPDNPRCRSHDIRGTPQADEVYGYARWDYIVSLRGSDLLYGGYGMDAYYAGPGNDTIIDHPNPPVPTPADHDHAWGGSGDDQIDISDGGDEPDHVEEAHGDFKDDPPGVDSCMLDNDAGDLVEGCETITVLNDDGTTITWQPDAGLTNTPSGVLVTVKPPNATN